jgi:hypothetical protein
MAISSLVLSSSIVFLSHHRSLFYALESKP